jgi:Holliday junction resolvasome RuvABC endonuclease subunit
MSQSIKIVSFDPSLRNWGIAQGQLIVNNQSVIEQVTVDQISVIKPNLTTGKQVRQNSLDLESANQLYNSAHQATIGCKVIFVEVPVGSQSSRAMASYGICVGVLGALRASGIPLFEVTPNEVKLASVGSKTASKAEMINWAVNLHPEAGWPMSRGSVVAGKAEHMADAIATIYAGIKTQPFQQILPFLNQSPNQT